MVEGSSNGKAHKMVVDLFKFKKSNNIKSQKYTNIRATKEFTFLIPGAK